MPLISARRPDDAALASWLDAQRTAPPTFDGPLPDVAPAGFDLDVQRTELGSGPAVFEAAGEALFRWAHCDLGWLTSTPRTTPPQVGQTFAMVARVAGLWFANACRVRHVVHEDGPRRLAGYEHVTLPHHAECGAESFLVSWPGDGAVVFEIRAVSRPARWWVAAGRPVVRAAQARFRRDSAAALARAVREALAARGAARPPA